MRIGVDLGGTKIEAVALDRNGHVQQRERIATPRGDYAAIVAAVAALVGRIEAALAVTARVGVGIPGTISATSGRVKNANTTELNGQPLHEDLSRALSRPVRVANDANCFATSEAADGAGAGAAVVFGVILGTGVGGGVVVDGRALAGCNGIAGEWGHNPLPAPAADELPGPACYCGRRGCLETWLSGPALARCWAGRGGAPMAPHEIVAAAERGDDLAESVLDDYERRLARGLAGVINVLDPDVIVLGGGLSKVQRLYRNVPRLWRRHVFSDAVHTRLLAPRHGDASGVRGAAWLWEPAEPATAG